MEIRGPLKIAVAETPGQGGWELHIDFRPEFRDLPLRDQGTSFRAYLTDLAASLAGLAQDDRNRQGILLVQQIAEQLLPHVESGELALNETIEVEISQAPVAALQDLIESSRV
jgi:hypothetical protein